MGELLIIERSDMGLTSVHATHYNLILYFYTYKIEMVILFCLPHEVV